MWVATYSTRLDNNVCCELRLLFSVIIIIATLFVFIFFTGGLKPTWPCGEEISMIVFIVSLTMNKYS